MTQSHRGRWADDGPEPKPIDACAFLTARLWSLHPGAESIEVRWNAETMRFDTAVRFPSAVTCAIEIRL